MGSKPLNHIQICNNIFKLQFLKTITYVCRINLKKPEVNILHKTISYTNIQFSRLCSRGAIVHSIAMHFESWPPSWIPNRSET